MKIAITGSSGAIGKLLIPILEATENEIIKFVRREPKNDREAYWNPSKRTIDMDVFQKVDAIIHLAGEPIAPLSILGFLPF